MAILFRVFLALLIAIPVGPGGICCCLFASPSDSAANAVGDCCGAPPLSCTASADDSATAVPPPAADCGCPVRESFLTETAASFAGIAPIAAPAFAFLVPAEAFAPSISSIPLRTLHRVPYPPPKLSRHRALHVERC